MPIFLEAPKPYAAGPDGRGWTRLSLGAHIGDRDAQCPLRPKTYAALAESRRSTQLSAWGPYRPCVSQAAHDCLTCPALTSAPREMPVNAPLVLVRIEERTVGEMFTAERHELLWPCTGPEDRAYRTGEPWDYEQINRLAGWEVGQQFWDQHGRGFWLERTLYVRAPHVEIRTQRNRHAVIVGGTRAALVVCSGECQHDERLLNLISHHTPESADEQRVTPSTWDLDGARAEANGLRAGAHHRSHYEIRLTVRRPETVAELLHVSFDGSTWTAAQITAITSAALPLLDADAAPPTR
ncbi:hypothetical protein ACFXPX_38470 [Kitasatospora sp. NPDC059146]|uniref:hypothetical protein n=1 Tax=unclassified Kitasatospora TaxID=2633591 RepID=UPI00368126EA